MLINSEELITFMKKGEILIDPFKQKNLGPNSYDLTIFKKVQLLDTQNSKFFYLSPQEIDRRPEIKKEVELPIFLNPGQVIRCATEEKIAVRTKTYAKIVGRSNLSRFPLPIYHGPLVDTGYEGVLTFAIHNVMNIPIKISPDLRVLQIMFYQCNPMKITYFKRETTKNFNQVKGKVPVYNVDKEHKNNFKINKEIGRQEESLRKRK